MLQNTVILLPVSSPLAIAYLRLNEEITTAAKLIKTEAIEIISAILDCLILLSTLFIPHANVLKAFNIIIIPQTAPNYDNSFMSIYEYKQLKYNTV